MDLFYNKLKISKEEFLFQYQSHPNYPSILAFSDTLNFLSIKNEAYEIDKENWHELPEKFITIYNDKFTVIEKSNDEYLIFNDKIDKISKEKLHTDSENIVFLFDEIDNVNDVKKINYKWIISSFFALIFIYSYFQFNQYLFIYNALTMIGLYLSLELFNNKFGVKSNIVNTLCSSNNVESSDTKNSCNKIFDSDKIFFLGLKLSDFSLVYFLGLLVLGILIKENIFLLKHISFLSGLVIFYSLYVQVFVEKTICKVCLLIVFSLIGQIVISLLFFEIKYNKDILFPSILIFALSFLLIIYLNDILKKNQKYYEISLKNIRFKKNYDIFKKELVVKQYSFNHKSKEFWIGSKKSKLNISLITNPYCGYCKEAHLILKKIIEKYPEISFQLRFNYFAGNTDENLTLLISTFRNIHKDQGEKGLLDAIEFWHNKNDIEIFKKEYKIFIYKTEMNDIIKMAEDNRNFALTYTPQILINNYLFPSLYERDDIFYFIDELLEDEEILNERL